MRIEASLGANIIAGPGLTYIVVRDGRFESEQLCSVIAFEGEHNIVQLTNVGVA